MCSHEFTLDFAGRNLNLVELFICKTVHSLSWTGISLYVHKDSGSSHLKWKIKKRRVLLFRVFYSHLLKFSEIDRGYIHLEIILLAIKMKMERWRWKPAQFSLHFVLCWTARPVLWTLLQKPDGHAMQHWPQFIYFPHNFFFSVKHDPCLTVLLIQYLIWNFFTHVTMYWNPQMGMCKEFYCNHWWWYKDFVTKRGFFSISWGISDNEF